MKVTDYGPRMAFLDTFLTPKHKIGVEVGVDVGAHAEAILSFSPWVTEFMLVDPWDHPTDWYKGYCEGRLRQYRNVEFMKMKSLQAADVIKKSRGEECLDFIYLDQQHDGYIVSDDLYAWWPLLDKGGILGHRNYSKVNTGLMKAVDDFVKLNLIKTKHDSYHNEIVLFK